MTAEGFGATDKISKAGDSATGTIEFAGTPPMALPAGTAGQVLTSDAEGNITLQPSSGGAGSYVPLSDLPISAANGGTGRTSLTADELLAGNGTGTVQSLAAGTTGQVLTSNGPGSLPSFATPASGFANPSTATGDLIYENSSAAAAPLHIGTTGQVLTVSGGLPAWENASAGFTDPMSAPGDLIYENSSSIPARLGIGTSSEVLTVVSGAPAWAPVSGSTAWINVKTEGATGNGTTDDTAAIQGAITAAEALASGGSAGAVVYFPYGSYKISSALSIASANITLIGDGGGGQYYGNPVKITQTSTTANGVTVANAWNVIIKGISFAGPGSGSGVGVHQTYSPTAPAGFCAMEDVYITGFGSHGLQLNEPIMSTFSRVWCYSNGGYGIYLAGGGTSCTFTSCWASYNTAGGWWINGNYHSASGCGADFNTGHGWTLSGAQSCSISGCGSEKNTGYGFYLTSSCYTCTLSGAWCWNTDIGLQIDASCYRIVVSGFLETPSGSPTYSISIANGAITTLITPQVSTAMSVPGSYCNQVLDNAFSSGYLTVHGLAGATAASRWVGATNSGAPLSGTFAAGDAVLDHTGNVWICSTAGTVGSGAVFTAAGAGWASNPMTTEGDLLYESSAPAPARLPIGTAGQVLTVSGGVPSWQNASGGSVDPSGSGGATMAGLGLGLLTVSPAAANADTNGNSEQLFGILCTATVSVTVTTLGVLLAQAGVTAGSGVNELALFSESGTLLARTGDMTTVFESTGFAEGAIANPGSITSYAITEGTNYYLAFLSSFTGTLPKPAGIATLLPAGALNGHYFARYLNSQATMPASITPSSMSSLTTTCCMYAR